MAKQRFHLHSLGFLFNFWLRWQTQRSQARTYTHTRTPTRTHSLWGRPQSCLSPQGQASKLECTLFSNQTLSTNILPSELDRRERDVFYGWCVCGLSVEGVVGRWFGFGHVSVFANGRNKSAAQSGTLLYHLFLFHASHCFSSSHIFPSSLNLMFLSILLCSAHFHGLRVKDSVKTQAKCQGQKHIWAWQFVDRVCFSWWSVFHGISCKWCNFTWKGEFPLCESSITLHIVTLALAFLCCVVFLCSCPGVPVLLHAPHWHFCVLACIPSTFSHLFGTFFFNWLTY